MEVAAVEIEVAVDGKIVMNSLHRLAAARAVLLPRNENPLQI